MIASGQQDWGSSVNKALLPILARLHSLQTPARIDQAGNRLWATYYGGFGYESGSSIKGRSKVSHLANKEAKALLNLAACCAIRCNDEMKQYYQKRVTEGKKKMSCLNIIRSKLVARMFAVIKRQTTYQEKLLAAFSSK